MLTRKINFYLSVLIITAVGSVATLIIVRTANETETYYIPTRADLMY